VSCPARLGSHPTGRGASILSCGEMEANPGPTTPDWGEEDYAVLPDLGREACSRLGIAPVRDVFATATNRRLPAFWSKAEDAFAQAWDYPSAGPLWANPPFSRLDEVVTKASREGSLMLVVAPEWGGPRYPWWAALCALCFRRWCFPEGQPVYLRGGTELIPAPRWRTWAFLLDSRPLVVPGPAAVPPAVPAVLTLMKPPPSAAEGALAPDPGADLMAAHRHADTLPLTNKQRRGMPLPDPKPGVRRRPPLLGPPPVASPFLPRPGRQSTNPTPAHAAVNPAADDPGLEARPRLQTFLVEPVVAPAACAPLTDLGDGNPTVTSSALPPPDGTPPAGPISYAPLPNPAGMGERG